MKIEILGSGCPTCKTLYQTVEKIVKKLERNFEVEYSDDITKIIEIGAISSPVLVINGQIISAGRVPSDQEITNIILEKIQNDWKDCPCGGNC